MVLDGARLELRDGRGHPLQKSELSLSDFHSLTAVARRLGVETEAPQTIRCGNCGATWDVVPCSRFEVGPYLDDELDDPELDADFDIDAEHDAGGLTLRLEPRTVGQARALLEAPSPLDVTPDVVRALGVVELDGETSPEGIAQLLAALDDETYAGFADVWEDAHYPPRLVAPHPCPECAAVEWLPIPAERELSVGAMGEAMPVHGFPSFDEVEMLVREVAPDIYAQLEIGEVSLSLLDGPAEVDDAGEPLLGSYLPPDPDALLPHGAEVRLYYRSFREMWRNEGPYDLRAEVSETIAHELTHHLGYLAGDDPLDDDERAAIGDELVRRVGRSEAERRATHAFVQDLTTFWRRTWVVWVIAAVGAVAAAVASR